MEKFPVRNESVGSDELVYFKIGMSIITAIVLLVLRFSKTKLKKNNEHNHRPYLYNLFTFTRIYVVDFRNFE